MRDYLLGFSISTIPTDEMDAPGNPDEVALSGIGAEEEDIDVLYPVPQPNLQPVDKVGGINLNLKQFDLQFKRDGRGVVLPFPQQPLQSIQIRGIVPVILYERPFDGPVLFGLS